VGARNTCIEKNTNDEREGGKENAIVGAADVARGYKEEMRATSDAL